ncbi:MAG: maleylpyruvate isomerase family mycothiol-dependent enzyme [Candidatus Dormibacteraeota bacterium]|uniref:Maleylpyruvate isomerase family mycothiol-dependent enzyme n=2 Tax=Candidatus Aeolococcus gillhamiae TaxID=3127015 RepID=A0A934K196_9BACT|nr:maleylpyruvate isomerase family mycothiol-dependent enzyme [Candidatus Dormibacteraeota bacterium]
MISSAVAVETIAPLGHDEAMMVATAEYDRLLAVVDELHDEDWSRSTDCVGWDVKAMLGHILGMLELQADPQERTRQIGAAAEVAAQTGALRLDAMTALQVSEHAGLTTDQLREALHVAAPRGLAARRATTEAMRATPYDPQLPGEPGWTVGYLFDVVHTRDPWIHRVDICRAIGREPELTADHDGRIVADVVADWARRHGQRFTLTLSGPAGGAYAAGTGGEDLTLDGVEFCRILSGREESSGLLATRIVF